MFFWRVSTFLDNLRNSFCPKRTLRSSRLQHISARRATTKINREIYPNLENISVDYAILEHATREASAARSVFVIPAEVGWSDIGSWGAVYELLAKRPAKTSSAGQGQAIDAEGNFSGARRNSSPPLVSTI